VAIPISVWDIFEDLLREYKTPDKVIIESIKALHRQLHGSLEDIAVSKPIVVAPSPFTISTLQSAITDGKIAKMAENGRKIDRITQKKLDKIDELLEKVKSIVEEKETHAKAMEKSNIKKEKVTTTEATIEESHIMPENQITSIIQQLKELSTLKDLSKEIQSMKLILKRLESGGLTGGTRRRRANLSTLDLKIKEASSSDVPLAPPERPLLETVLDSMLLIDDSDEDGEKEENNEVKQEDIN